jgi:alpha-glucosidase
VLSNHDIIRHTTRLAIGRGGTAAGAGSADHTTAPIDTELGLRRARAAILLLLALPGSVYLYQGEELGLPEVLDLPASVRQDPVFARTGGAELGRDGCRVPLPWSGTRPPYGFGAGPAWLPQPTEWAELSVAAQRHEPASTLNLYRQALRLRRELGLGRGDDVTWHSDADADLIILSRRAGIVCAVNLGDSPAEVSIVDGSPLVASAASDGMVLPADGAAWWSVL